MNYHWAESPLPRDHTEEAPKEDPIVKPPNLADGDGEDNNGSNHNPDPDNNPGNGSKAEQADPGMAPAEAISDLAKLVKTDQDKALKARVQESEPFDSSNLRKLRGFLLLCTLNFRSKDKAFKSDRSKVNYVLSFLKGTQLDYFKPYLTNDPANEPTWKLLDVC